MNKNDTLVWIDLEMTGLNARKDVILEFAMVITDNNLRGIAPSFSSIIHQPQEQLLSMDAWVKEHHTKSGLLAMVADAKTSIVHVEEQALALLRAHCKEKNAPLCGNSIWQDANFLRVYMPKLMDYLHYRMVDVSSVKEIIKRWYPDDKRAHFIKSDTHRALQDIQESIAELAWYRQHFFIQNDSSTRSE